MEVFPSSKGNIGYWLSLSIAFPQRLRNKQVSKSVNVKLTKKKECSCFETGLVVFRLKIILNI